MKKFDCNSFSYTAAKFWNALPDKLRTLSSLHDFILAIRRYRLIVSRVKYFLQLVYTIVYFI